MTEIIITFDMVIEIGGGNVDEFGEELALFLYESIFNGEDVLSIEYVGHRLNKK